MPFSALADLLLPLGYNGDRRLGQGKVENLLRTMIWVSQGARLSVARSQLLGNEHWPWYRPLCAYSFPSHQGFQCSIPYKVPSSTSVLPNVQSGLIQLQEYQHISYIIWVEEWVDLMNSLPPSLHIVCFKWTNQNVLFLSLLVQISGWSLLIHPTLLTQITQIFFAHPDNLCSPR